MKREDVQIYALYKKIILEADESSQETLEPQQKETSQTNKKMSSAEVHNFKAMLLDCRRELAQKSPYLYRVLDHLHVVPTYSIPTMAVDDKLNIYINPDFAFNLENRNKSMVTGVLAHETLHHENRTFSRQEWRDGKLWNLATDFIMNRDLDIDGFVLPEEGCIPIKGSSDRYTVKLQSPPWTENVEIDITNATCEYLYNRLAERLPDKENNKQGEEDEQDKKNNTKDGREKEGKEGGKQGETSSEVGKGKGRTKIEVIGKHGPVSGPYDKHIDPDSADIEPATDDPDLQPNDGDPKELEKELIKQKEQAHQEIELTKDRFIRNAQAGTLGIGRNLERQEALNRGNVNWQVILRDNLTRSVENTMRTYSRLNKKALGGGWIAPSWKPGDEKPEITIALDSSGSISNKTLVRFIEEVMQITKVFEDYDILVLVYNDNVVDNFRITPQTRQNVLAKLRSPKWLTGGNRESCIKEWLDTKGIKKLDLFILFTDGGVNSNSVLPAAVKTFFMVLKGNSADILKKLNANAPVVWVNLPNIR